MLPSYALKATLTVALYSVPYFSMHYPTPRLSLFNKPSSSIYIVLKTLMRQIGI